MEAVNTGLYINRLQDLLVLADHVVVELAESVEFKSLPSGLHHVEEDLVYVCANCSRQAILRQTIDTSFMMETMLASAHLSTDLPRSRNAMRSCWLLAR